MNSQARFDAHSFLKTFGSEEAERIAVEAGSNLAYFRQLACGARRPSVTLAEKLVDASGGRLGFVELLKYTRASEAAA